MESQTDSPAASPTSAPSPIPSSDQKSCWECSRRRLVCDEGRPTCQKCRAAGIVCPGYSSAKPLRWLAPGRVTARIRRKPKRKGAGSAASGGAKAARAPPAVDTSTTDTNSPPSSTSSEGGPPSDVGELSKPGVSEGVSDVEVAQRPSDISWLTWEVPRPPVRRIFVSDETEIVQATYYYNYHVFPEYSVHQLVPSIFIIPLPLETISLATPAMVHILVSVAIRHRIYRVASNSGGKDNIMELRSKFYHHRDKAITALNDEIRNMRNAYSLMVSAVMFVFAELQQSRSPAWKVHMDAFMGMISRGGGMTNICRAVPEMKTTMILYSTLRITGCTTSPASSSNLKKKELEDMLRFTEEVWEETPYPSFMCPTEVLHVIMHINYLRAKLLEGPLDEPSPGPEELLSRLEAFSPEVWAASKACANEQWLLITRANRSAAILYGIATLGPHFPPSSLQKLEVLRAVHGADLLSVLRETHALPAIRMGSLWPLIVAGVEVAKEDGTARPLVRKRFDKLADDLATPLMLEAKGVLEKYWESEKEGWDECFDRPYAFVL